MNKSAVKYTFQEEKYVEESFETAFLQFFHDLLVLRKRPCTGNKKSDENIFHIAIEFLSIVNMMDSKLTTETKQQMGTQTKTPQSVTQILPVV